MTVTQQLITVAVMAVATALTRFLPFWFFNGTRETPKVVTYLGKALPPAIFGMLVVYCLKDVQILSGSHGLPELIAIALIVAVHLWKRNMLLSVAVGTIGYMLLVQLVF